MAEKTKTNSVNEEVRLSHGTPELQELIRKRFTPEGKAERVARSLAALREINRIELPLEEWHRIVEDPEFEDQ